MKVHRIYADGVAINDTTGALTGTTCLDALLVHVSAAPTTSEYFTVKVASAQSTAFDTVLYKLDLSAASTTDIVLTGADLGVPLVAGDALLTTYANTDKRRIGITYLLR